MKADLFSIGPLTVHGYGLMIGIGIIAAYFVGEYRAKKYGLDSEQIFGLTIWSVIGGMAGAKLLYYLTEIKDIIADPSLLLDIGGGFVVYGGIITGILTAIIYCRIKKLEFLKYLDICIPSVALAQGFGRIGCFLAGCCYGRETGSPLGVVFDESLYAPNGVSLIPTQTISSALDFLHFIILVIFASRFKKADGQVVALYLTLYSIGRFAIEFFRGDIERGSVGILSTSQFISIFACIAGIIMFVMAGMRAKKKSE